MGEAISFAREFLLPDGSVLSVGGDSQYAEIYRP